MKRFASARPWTLLAGATGVVAGVTKVRTAWNTEVAPVHKPPARTQSAGHAPRLGSTELHRLNPNLMGAGITGAPRRLGTLHTPKSTHVVRIALTGGPCAGKSSALERLGEKAKEAGFDLFVAPETATVLFNCGFAFPTDPTDPRFDEMVFQFQKNLFKMQLQLERTMTAIAASSGRPSIVVYDRGLLDGKGYMPLEMWTRVLSQADEHRGVTEEYVLNRYDGVIHLVTAADGAPDFYKWGNTVDDRGNSVYRCESPSEAIEMDRKMRDCWKNHKRHCVITNENNVGFNAKLDAAAEEMLRIASLSHPQQLADARRRASAVQ